MMDLCGFSSPRSDCFPAGLRVLVVDDDPTWLKILEKMLKKCNYEVTTCNLARDALDLLRERKDRFDIVISDVNMPDMDGFKLLEQVGLEMDLPVIMMSVDGETRRVMKGVQHGACDYLLKPIRMKELRNIWQHVLRKRIHEVRDIEVEEIYTMRNVTEQQSDDGYLFSGDLITGKKRKDTTANKNDDSSSSKKSRVVWTVDLHQKFVKAVNQIGLDKVGPKKVLDLMGVTWLTRENVASHLQKYRLYLSRLQTENELKATLGGIKSSNIYSEDHSSVNVCLQNPLSQNSVTMQQKIVINESSKNLNQKDNSKICEENMNGIISGPMSKTKKALLGDVNDPMKSNTSRLSFGHSLPKIEVQSWQEEKSHFQAEKPRVASIEPSYGNTKSPGIERVTKVESTAALFSVQPQFIYRHAFENNLFGGVAGPSYRLWEDELNCFSSQGVSNPPYADYGCYGSQELIADVPYHSLNFDSEYTSDSLEYPVIDQGLFIA
ncbi:hypothetical protein RD792_004582 [Penstemon davidsonii]|uniref:Response regulatory domain-containing protein n=1 Tax=Penstemon davidsonii TaxID=160366 RepID=A0ABR0DHR9_9LAMI|nr:hypothetical protein RD792_004582 [Penstemon davidsonii]